MSIDVTPPVEIVEFAEEAGYKWGVEYVREWNGYQVFFPNFKPTIDVQDVGLPQYILQKDNKTRWANDEEQGQLMYLDNE